MKDDRAVRVRPRHLGRPLIDEEEHVLCRERNLTANAAACACTLWSWIDTPVQAGNTPAPDFPCVLLHLPQKPTA